MPYFNSAYKELGSNNVLYEYTVQGNYLSVNTYVKFTNDILLGFFLANKWIEENGLSLDLIKRINKFYEKSSQLQINILKYLIKFAFMENKHTKEAIIYGHFLKLMQYFLAGDNENCRKEYELFQTIELDDSVKPAMAGYFFGAQLIYQSVFFDKIEPDLMDSIYKKSELFYISGVQSKSVNPIFEHIIVYSLKFFYDKAVSLESKIWN